MNNLEWRFSHSRANEIYGGDWKRSRPDDAGIDLRIMESVFLEPGAVVKCPSGIAINIDSPNVAGIVLPRSGLGTLGIVLGNTVGLIDCGYQGDLTMTLWNRSKEGHSLAAGSRVAQLVLIPVLHPVLNKVEQFTESMRGENGFGSSGVT